MRFEALAARGARRAEARAKARREEIAAEIGTAMPEVTVEVDGEGVRLSGPGLGRRYARDARLRWLIGEATR